MTDSTALQAMETTLTHYWIQLPIVAAFAVFSIRTCVKEGRDGDKYAALGILLIVIGLWTLFDTTIPLTREYTRREIAIAEGVYNKSSRQGGGRHSRALRMETVTIETETQTLVLTTYPRNRGEFPVGTWSVIAYYTPNTEFLLHIEILDTASTS